MQAVKNGLHIASIYMYTYTIWRLPMLRPNSEGYAMPREDIAALSQILYIVAQGEGHTLNNFEMRELANELRSKVDLAWGDLAPMKMFFVPTEHFSESLVGTETKEPDNGNNTSNPTDSD